MKSQLQITFRNMKASQEVEQWIRAEAAKLEMLYPQIMGCRVALGIPHRHHQKGRPYHIRIDLTVPNGEIVVKREPSLNSRARHLGEAEIQKHSELRVPHKDLQLAISDVFKAAGRQLQDYARRKRRQIKSHTLLPHAQVSKILQERGYGFLTADDGREIYFHKNSVLGRAFPRMKVGTNVTFVEETGDKGLQASTVRVIARRARSPIQENAASTD